MKKGQLGSLVPLVSTILVIGILIVAGFLLIEQFRDNDNFFEGQSVINESGFINATGYTLEGAADTGAKSFVITEALNATDNSTIGLGNLTVNSEGVVFNATATVWSDALLSYTYESGTQGYTGLNTTMTAILTIPNLLGLLILIAMVGIILATLFRVIPTTEGA